MEVILSSTTAQKHFYGKLTGVLLVALTQMALYGIIFGVGYNQFKDMEMVKNILDGISLDNLIGPFLWYSLLFMIFGILIFLFWQLYVALWSTKQKIQQKQSCQ